MTRVPYADRNPALTVRDGQVFASSREVAETFGRDHKHVLASVDRIVNDCPEAGPNFRPSEYHDSTGRTLRCFDLTRDGFALLAMGFTGRRALAWKLKYIEAFNAMEAELLRSPPSDNPFASTQTIGRDDMRQLCEWLSGRLAGTNNQITATREQIAALAETLKEMDLAMARLPSPRQVARISHEVFERHIAPPAAASLSMHSAREVAVMVLGSEEAVHRRLSALLCKELDRYGRSAGRCWQQGNVRGIPAHLSPRTFPIQGITEWLTGPAGGAEWVRTENDRLNRRDQERAGIVQFPQQPEARS